MAGSVNKVILIGNVGKDPEIRTSQSGARFASFTVATGESWKDKATGERKERTEWHNVNITNDALVGIAERYVKKGSKLYIEGQLETRKWTDGEGKDRYTTEVVLRPYRGELTLLDSRQGGSEGGGSYGGGGSNNNSAPAYDAPKSGGASFADDLDDEIPF